MGIYKNIQIALQKRLEAMPSIPFIWYPNDSKNDNEANIANTNIYLRVRTVFDPAEEDTVDGRLYIPGYFQIDIFTKLDIGEAKLVQLRDTIHDHFRASPVLTQSGTTVFIETCDPGGNERVDNWWWGFLQVNFNCYE